MQSERTIELVKWQERPARTRGALPKIRGSLYPNRVAPLFTPKPPRHIPHLPNEILILIIESVDNESDRATLARLCLVSKDFLLPSRKALYANISIYEHDPTKESKDSSALLCGSLSLRPHLAALVRRVKIFDPDRRNSPKYWISSYLQTLLPVCLAVDSLHAQLYFDAGIGDRESDAMEILKMLGSLASRLKHLDLYVKSELEISRDVSTLLRSATGLKSLIYRGQPDLIGEPPTFELEELIISEGHAEAAFEALTRSSHSSLRVLHVLEVYSRSHADFAVLDLTRLPNLHTLKLVAHHTQIDQETLLSHIFGLPLHHLDLHLRSSRTIPRRDRTSYFSIPPDLSPTLTDIRLKISQIDDITTFLKSGMCPLLSGAKFEPQSKPNPWSLIAMARAAKERGLRVVEKEPRWDGNYDLDQRWGRDRWPPAEHRPRQTLLAEFWGPATGRA